MSSLKPELRAAIAEARSLLKSRGVTTLLARPIANPKLAKSLGIGIVTAPLHLAPAKLSGFNVCAKSTKGCRAACLHTAGNPAYMQGKARARIARTRAFFDDRAAYGNPRDAFMLALWDDIRRLQAYARRHDMRCGVRLNATSDIRWERETVRLPVSATQYEVLPNLMAAFPGVQFYDYTAISNRRNLPRNYHLTFSLKEANDADAIEALANGMNVAAVFNVRRGQPLPLRYLLGAGVVDLPATVDVIDGDLHDFRPLDPRGVVVGLRAKGKAISDASGFVRAAVSI